MALDRLGRDEDALAAHDQALRLNPDSANSHHGRGVALERLGRDEEALAAFDEAARLIPVILTGSGHGLLHWAGWAATRGCPGRIRPGAAAEPRQR